jgi:hypothetical protein
MANFLSRVSIDRAIDHICRYGDTDIFPHLLEIAFLQDRKEDIVHELTRLDIDQFQPHQSVEARAPKSRYGFRLANQLLLTDALVLTASVIEIGGDLELKKASSGEFGPFAYRFSDTGGASLFQPDRTYKDWLDWQRTQLIVGDFAYVIFTDVADFYQRIYFHRLESSLDTATSNTAVKRTLLRL